MKMLLIDVENPCVQEVDANGLDDYYRLIGCDCIDVTVRKVAGMRLPIICDDEGYFKEKPIRSAYYEEPDTLPLVGNLLICGGMLEGKLLPLTDEQKEKVQNEIFATLDLATAKVRPILRLQLEWR